MTDEIRRLTVGEAVVHVINIGDVQEDLNGWFDLTAEEQARHQHLLAQPLRFVIQNIHVALSGVSLLVDAGLYDYPPDAPQLIPGYYPTLDLFAGLEAIGVKPETITHLIITHAHGDHFNALSELHEGEWKLCFPNARHYLGQGDWEAMQPELADPNSLQSRTFGMVQQQGLLEIVTGLLDLGHGIQIVPTPGESPGHQAVRLESQGQLLYCIGDLYHLPAEAEFPELFVPWTNRDANHISRQQLNEAALAENALLIATHIHEFGRIERTETGWHWANVQE
ncbi:MAG: MBL fold metallo-hydrolase [Caldilineaceae bacterium]